MMDIYMSLGTEDCYHSTGKNWSRRPRIGPQLRPPNSWEWDGRSAQTLFTLPKSRWPSTDRWEEVTTTYPILIGRPETRYSYRCARLREDMWARFFWMILVTCRG